MNKRKETILIPELKVRFVRTEYQRIQENLPEKMIYRHRKMRAQKLLVERLSRKVHANIATFVIRKCSGTFTIESVPAHVLLLRAQNMRSSGHMYRGFPRSFVKLGR